MSVEQCCVEVQKLHQMYMKVRDAMRKSGRSGEETDKCPFCEDLDKILGTRPTVCPEDIVESHEETSASGTPSPAPSCSCSADVKFDENGEACLISTVAIATDI